MKSRHDGMVFGFWGLEGTVLLDQCMIATSAQTWEGPWQAVVLVQVCLFLFKSYGFILLFKAK
jgi:hypothetical protein